MIFEIFQKTFTRTITKQNKKKTVVPKGRYFLEITVL